MPDPTETAIPEARRFRFFFFFPPSSGWSASRLPYLEPGTRPDERRSQDTSGAARWKSRSSPCSWPSRRPRLPEAGHLPPRRYPFSAAVAGPGPRRRAGRPPNFESVWRKGIPLRIDHYFAGGGPAPSTLVHGPASPCDGVRGGLGAQRADHLDAPPAPFDSLRGVVYFDEIAGCVPPHPARPRLSKAPLFMCSSRRWASSCWPRRIYWRSKSRSNTKKSTWLVGKLQAQLRGPPARRPGPGRGAGPSRAELDDAISALKGPYVLLKNVRPPSTPFVTTRWAPFSLSLQNLPTLFRPGTGGERNLRGRRRAAPAARRPPAGAGAQPPDTSPDPRGRGPGGRAPGLPPVSATLFFTGRGRRRRWTFMVDPASAPPIRYLPRARARLRAVFERGARALRPFEPAFLRMAGPLDRSAPLRIGRT